ncbi:MAG: hypothetical protein R2867_01025 [Caldilineaceae bacterium]
MRRQGSRLARLERLEATRPAEPTSHTVIYDVTTREVLNGQIPQSAKTVFWIPDNHRSDDYEQNK